MLCAARESCHRFCQKSLYLLTKLCGQAKALIAARAIRLLQDTLDLQLRLIKNAQKMFQHVNYMSSPE
ncbi:hypothetical protein ALQ97_200041 [Pseudomonas savastanoi pv. glycinea]|nr:hypothetical protein ALQ97_200041 [Pseudomonas savastanoi pv. glycinea]